MDKNVTNNCIALNVMPNDLNLFGLTTSAYRNDEATRGKVGRIIDRIFINKEKKTVTVKFVDGSTQTVTCHGDDVFDPVVGVAIAVSSFVFGSKKNFHDVVNRKIKATSSK